MFRLSGDVLSYEALQLRYPQLLMMVLGALSLIAGTLVYVVDRPASTVYFIPDSFRIAESTPLVFGMLGDYLPAFFHALAFALFSGSIVGRRYIGIICLGWFTGEVFFELAQLDAIAFAIAGAVPSWFSELPLLENIPSHFVTGQFDTMDVLFLLLGCGTAFAIGKLALPQMQNGQRRRHITSRRLRLAVLLLVTVVGFTSILGSGGTGLAIASTASEQASR